jgi:hypothetical protein
MSSKEISPQEQERVALFFGALFAIWLLYSLGPLVILIAALTGLALALPRAPVIVSLGVMAASAIVGMISHLSLTDWLMSPIHTMWDLFSLFAPRGPLYLLLHPDAFDVFTSGIMNQYGLEFGSLSAWGQWFPAGCFTGAAARTIYQLWKGHPLGQIKRMKVMEKPHGNVSQFAANINDKREAHTMGGSIIGADKYARIVELTDRAANQHTLVLGTTGSGKTVTVCNVVESAINRGIPLIYIDGKGDYDLARRIVKYGEERGKPVSLFSMKGDSMRYNPLATGGFTSKKDRIIELRDWSEEHYKKLAEGYLQAVFKVMEACKIPCDMASLADNLDIKKLKALVRENEKSIPNAQSLMDELGNQDQASKSIESLTAEIRNFTASEIGPLFQIDENKPVLTLIDIIENNGIAYFCLPALEFPSMSQTLGRLVINDLKATMAQQLGKGDKKKVYVVFDEFSVFAGEQVLNVINMGRSAGIHAVLSTQSLSDIASGRKDNADHFINQVVANCNNFILHRQNSPEDAEKLAAMMGTRNTLEYTAQVSQTGPTNMGTVRRTRGFIAHPDEIKALQTGEAFFYAKENNKVSRIKARRSRI